MVVLIPSARRRDILGIYANQEGQHWTSPLWKSSTQKYLLSRWPHIWLSTSWFWLCCHGPEVGLEVNQVRVYACQQANDLLKNGKWWAIMKPKKILGWIRLWEQNGEWVAYKCQNWTQLLQVVSVTNELFKCSYQSTTQSWQSQNWQACACVRTHTRLCPPRTCST